MRPRLFASGLAACLALASPLALAGPAIEKEKLGPMPSESSLDREQALRLLVEGESLLAEDTFVDALTKMLEAYIALEQIDGAEARGVKELRSWLVKVLEQLELADEAASLRARGSYVDHPLEVMPSTWFVPAGVEASSMNIEQALVDLERGLGMLERGEVEGLALLLTVYEVVETELGPESEDAKVLRSFLVGLLETGGFADEGKVLRARGSVVEATAEDLEVYAATWTQILSNSENDTPAISKLDDIKRTDTSNAGDTSSDSSSLDSSTNEDEDEDEVVVVDDKPKVLSKGSAIPAVLIDLGIGSFQPEYGRKGLIWSAGLELHWTLFTARWFGMQLGGGGNFGRNRDKRWQADAHGELRLSFDFQKVYLRPEFGGGYDQLAGGKQTIAAAYHVAPAAYYHFGGSLGVRIAERYQIYARAVRLNRDDRLMLNETRLRAGFVLGFDEAALDMAFVLTDYDARDDAPGARTFSGNLGIRF